MSFKTISFTNPLVPFSDESEAEEDAIVAADIETDSNPYQSITISIVANDLPNIVSLYASSYENAKTTENNLSSIQLKIDGVIAMQQIASIRASGEKSACEIIEIKGAVTISALNQFTQEEARIKYSFEFKEEEFEKPEAECNQ